MEINNETIVIFILYTVNIMYLWKLPINFDIAVELSLSDGCKSGPITTAGLRAIMSMLFSFANFQAASSAKVLESVYQIWNHVIKIAGNWNDDLKYYLWQKPYLQTLEFGIYTLAMVVSSKIIKHTSFEVRITFQIN